MSDTTYNGWKNYPTWAVNLWLNNDPWSQEWALGITRDALLNSEHGRLAVADALKHNVREMTENDNATLASDLLGYALDCVDWHETADAFIEMAEEVTA